MKSDGKLVELSVDNWVRAGDVVAIELVVNNWSVDVHISYDSGRMYSREFKTEKCEATLYEINIARAYVNRIVAACNGAEDVAPRSFSQP